jgi:nitroimidazol reductase NimA-like FMN-containing flavoprotein (pyridoxamine 5'-phosphate oxidase superfamily)
MNSIEKSKYIIENNNLMVISTANADGKPWISPVAFAYDESYNFYWVSSKDALHSDNVRNRPEVAIVIYGQMPDGGPDGVYVDAKASELVDLVEIQKGIQLFAEQRPQPAHFAAQSPADVTGDAAWRMYRAVPIEISKRANSVSNGQTITIRELVQL